MKIRGKKSRKKNRKKRGRVSWPIAQRWVATGTLVACTALGNKRATTLFAQDRQGSVRSSTSPQASALLVHHFSIPPGPLGEVLMAFEKVANLHVVASNKTFLTLTSPGVSGLFTDEQALQKLLTGMGIEYRFTAAGTVVLFLRTQVQSVQVRGHVQPVISPKFPEPILDTPQSITVVPSKVMQEQGVTTLRDALRNVAGISLAAGEGSSQGDNLTVRGFTARNDIFLDGMRDFGSYYRDPFDLENVEVLQGPSGVMFGRGSTGGVVSQQSKTPNLDPFISGTIMYGTDQTKRLTLDVNRPLPGLAQGAAFRLNLMGDEGGVAGRDVTEERRLGVAPSLMLGLGTPTQWTFSYLHEDEDDIPDYGIPWLFNAPAPVPRENYYGFKDGNFLRTYVDVGTAAVEHDVNHAVAVHDQVRYAHYIRDVQITEPQVDPSTTIETPLNEIIIDRNQIAANSIETFLDDQLDVTFRFQTGPFAHTLVAGIEGSRETSDPVRPSFTGVPETSLMDPDPNQPFAGTSTIRSAVHTTAWSYGAYAIDTMKLSAKWNLTGGIRWDYFDTDYLQSVAPASAFTRIDEQPTYRAAIVYTPTQNSSIYFDYGTSFDPSAEALSLSASTANLPPEQNRTFELGGKWNTLSRRASLRAALFSTEQTNAREPDPDNPLLDVLAGVERVNGFELEQQGRLTSRWALMASYALLDSKVVKSQYYPASVGAQLANVPRNTFNFWSTYELPWRIEAGAGGGFVDSRTASSTAPTDPTTGLVKEVPGYWEFNAMAKYPLTERLSLQLNVYNLANKYYYDEIHPGHIIPGAGRSALISLIFKF